MMRLGYSVPMAVALAWTCSLFAQAHGVPCGSGDATMLGAASGRRQDQARPIYDELTEQVDSR